MDIFGAILKQMKMDVVINAYTAIRNARRLCGDDNMKKSVFLHVKGDDFSASLFMKHFKPEEVYQQMLAEGVTYKLLDEWNYYIEVRIVKFGEVDDDFVDFVKFNLFDYYALKHENIFRVA